MDTSKPLAAGRVRPEWLPPENRYAAVEAGKWWDVVAIDGALGEQTATRLDHSGGDGCGPIAVTRYSDRWYFFTPVGTAEHWREAGIQALGRGSHFGLPGSLEGVIWPVRWVVPPRLCPYPPLVDVARLREALQASRPRLRGVS